MSSKKLCSILLAFMMLFSMTFSYAEDPIPQQIPETLYYQGGVVMRAFPKGTDAASADSLLQLAYMLTDTPYLLLNAPTTWELTISGGQAPYTCEVLLAHQADLSMDQFEDGWSVPDYFEVSGSSFDYTFTEAGRYFWEIHVTDAAGQYVSFQTRVYESYTTADETNVNTVAGKVNSIIAANITDSMSDYSRARVLHDWLIYNANYDYTYTNYDASGVLLYGSGVCDSYARAYLMLMTAAGVECMIVSGTAGSGSVSTWGNHAWNLVKLGDSWYHVDCTWDDPGEGGYENHDYFCVDDDTLSADHRWNRPDDVFDIGGMITPEAEGGAYEAGEAALGDYDFTFSTIEEYEAGLDAMIAAGEFRHETVGLYTGSDSYSNFWTNTFTPWCGTKAQALANQGLITAAGRGYYGNLFTISLVWVDPDEYIRITEETMNISIGEKATVSSTEFQSATNAFTWSSSDPSVATVSTAYDEGTGAITATISGVSAGTTIITATSVDGLSDSLTVTVLPALTPDFALSITDSETGTILSWNGIPGVTNYTIMRRYGSTQSQIATTTSAGATLTATQLPANVLQQVYIIGQRKVGSTVAATYTSSTVSYGSITYTAVLPTSATTIKDEAFLGNTSLTAVSIPDGVTTIGQRAFSGCTAMEAVSIPASVTTIGDDAFLNCPLVYAQVTEGSTAANWLAEHYPDVILLH